jgi:hypothetical protein
MIAADLDERYIQALARILPGDGAQARAGLLVALVLGVRMMRDIVKAPAFGDAHRPQLKPLVEELVAQLVEPAPP